MKDFLEAVKRLSATADIVHFLTFELSKLKVQSKFSHESIHYGRTSIRSFNISENLCGKQSIF